MLDRLTTLPQPFRLWDPPTKLCLAVFFLNLRSQTSRSVICPSRYDEHEAKAEEKLCKAATSMHTIAHTTHHHYPEALNFIPVSLSASTRGSAPRQNIYHGTFLILGILITLQSTP